MKKYTSKIFNKENKIDLFILIGILVVAFVLRIYRLPEMVGFDFDQEYAAIFASGIINEYPVQLLGQGLSVQGLFMGPFYFYYLVPFFAIFNLHPIGGYIGSIVLGLIITALYYFLLRDVFGRKAGLIASFLRAILFLKIGNDWVMAPSYSSELVILLTWYFLYKYWKGSYKYLVGLGFVFGLYTSFHPILFPFYLVFIIFIILKHFVKRDKIKIRYFVFSFLLFLIPLAPLVLFEYLHKFQEVKVLFALDGTSSATSKTTKDLIDYSLIVLKYPGTVLGISKLMNIIIPFSILIYSGFILMSIKKLSFYEEKFHLLFFPITIIVFICYYYFLQIRMSDYYLLGVEVIFFIYLCGILGFLMEKKFKLTLLILAIILVLNLKLLVDHWNRPFSLSLKDKESVVREIARLAPDNKLNLNLTYDYGQQYGFGYLLRLYKIDPKRGDNNPTYNIIVPSSKVTEGNKIFESGNVSIIKEN